MKKSFILFVASLLALAGCSRNQEINVPEDNLSLFARTESPADTKTVVESGTHVFWEPGDEFAVFMGEKSAKFTTDITASSATATFKGTFGDTTWPEELDLWAVYPFSEDAVFDGETITTTLPSEQIAREGSFGKDMNLSIAHSNSSSLQFYNVGGGIRFSVTEDGIKKVMFEGLSGEIISGKVKIGFENGLPVVKEVTGGSQFITLLPPAGKETFEKDTWYFIVAIPGALEGGYKLRFYKDSDYARKVSEKAVTIKRSIFGNIEKADKGIEYEAQTTHFPETIEEIRESEQKSLELCDQVDDVFRQAGFYDVNAEELDIQTITSSIRQIEGVLSVHLEETQKMITVMKKDSTIIHFVFEDYSSYEDHTETETECLYSEIVEMARSQSINKSGSTTKKALLLSPFQNSFWVKGQQMGNFHVNETEIQDLLRPLGYSLKFLKDDEASLDKFTLDYLADYDLVMIISHGGGLDQWFSTTVISGSYNFTSENKPDLYRLSEQYVTIGDIPRYGINPKWLEMTYGGTKRFNNSIIYMGACHSYDIDDMKDLFLQHGAAAYYGFVGEIPYSNIFNFSQSAEILYSLVRSFSRGMDASAAYDFTYIDKELQTLPRHDYTFKLNPEAQKQLVFLADPRPKELNANVSGNTATLNWKCDYVLDACKYLAHTDGRNFSLDPALNQSVSVTFNNSGTYPWSVVTNVYARTTSSNEPIIVATYHVDGEPFTVEEEPSVTIITNTPTNIGPCSAEIPFSITTDESICGFGIIYSTDNNSPVVGNLGDGHYSLFYTSNKGSSQIIKELKPNTTYFARAFVSLDENNRNCIYGNTIQFTTKGISYSTSYKDLGLSVSWATCNLGSSSPSNVGGYYRWGETTLSSSSTSYKWGSRSEGFTKYNASDGKTILDASDDAASVNLGGKWRMPTNDEMSELRNNCTWAQATRDGVRGCTVTGPNGESIFIPVSEGITEELYAEFLTSELDTPTEEYHYVRAFSYCYDADNIYFLSTFRFWGHPIRPVFDDPDSKPKISASPTTLNYGDVKVGQSLGNAAGRVVFTNSGGSTLSITSIDCPDGFSHSPNLSFPISISAGDSKTITFAFRPTEVKTYSGYIQVYSNASNGVCKVKVTGNGIE